MESRKVAEERKYERNRIKYIEGLEKVDKENFQKIAEKQGKLKENLDGLSENIKNLAMDDKSDIFGQAYPANPSIDSCISSFV